MRASRGARRTARRARTAALGCGLAVTTVAAIATRRPSWIILALVAVLLVGERAATNRRHHRQLAEANRLAATDELTGLANRRALLTAIDTTLATDADLGLMLIDLDDFKTVNDTHGHVVGDHVLRMVAARLREALAPNCLVARLGGDEFAVLLRHGDHHALPVLTTRVQAALARPLLLGAGGYVMLSTSAGAATRTKDTTTATDLLHQADTAMYRAKRPAPPGDQPTHPDRRHRKEPDIAPDDGPPRHAQAAAESLQRLNGEATHGIGYLWPSQTHTTISHLWLLTHHLTRAMTHLARWLEEQHDAGRVRRLDTPDADPAVRAALEDLAAAITHNHRTTKALGAARQHTTGLTGHPFGRRLN
jgi:diguanylate cyclase (GGDEF)-like protein